MFSKNNSGTLFVLITIAVLLPLFTIIPRSSAGEVGASTRNVQCHDGGGSREHDEDSAFPGGQAFGFTVNISQNDLPSPLAEAWVSPFPGRGGYYFPLQNESTGNYPGSGEEIGADTGPYKWLFVHVECNGTILNQNDFQAVFNARGRIAEHDGTSYPTTITSGDPVTISWRSTNAWDNFINSAPEGGTFFKGGDITGGFTATHVWDSTGFTGSASFQTCARGPNVSGDTADVCESFSINVEPPALPQVDLKCDDSDGPCTLTAGSRTTLTWSSNNADSCTASGDWSGSKPRNNPSGEDQGPLSPGGYSYTLTCENSFGSRDDTVQVNVTQPPDPTQPVIAGLPACAFGGYTATISWTGTPFSGIGFLVDVSEDPAFGSFSRKTVNGLSTSAPAGFVPALTLRDGRVYYVRVTGEKGTSASNSFSVPTCTYNTCIGLTCSAVPGIGTSDCAPLGSACSPPAACTFTATPSKIVMPPRGTSSLLRWTCSNVQPGTCTINQGVGPVSENGSTPVFPGFTTTYTLTCQGLDGVPQNFPATVQVFLFTGGQIIECNPDQVLCRP